MMKLQHIPLDQIVWNPWKDKDRYPVDEEQITELRSSIKDHGFFSSLMGRRQDGKIELAFGHARLEAARKAREETVPIFIDEIDDDEMLALMTDENATQRGSNAGAVLNEVEAVTRRLIEGLLGGTIVPPEVKRAFEDKGAIDRACGRLRRGTDVHIALGHNVIRAYLGKGDPKNAKRGERQIREAISALKQSGRYDEIVNAELLKHPEPVTNKEPAKRAEIAKAVEPKKHQRILDERTASVFPNDHQFHAFREAITTQAAQQVIPVNQQLSLAKEIMSGAKPVGEEGVKGASTKKQIGAPYIKMMVQAKVQEGIKQQRQIDKEERDRYLREQTEEQIDAELYTANAAVRSLLSSIAKLDHLARKYPAHPKIGGFGAKLDRVADAITQFSKTLKGKKS